MAAMDVLAVSGMPAAARGGMVLGCPGCADLSRQLADALRLAYTDELTLLPNRRVLYREMDSRAQSGQGYALAFLDVDGFKAINDHFGHDMGDWVLFHLAGRLRGLANRPGWLAARLGGDEFAVLLPAMGVDDAAAAARDIHECTGEPLDLLTARIFPWATVGVAVAAAHETPSAVRRRADLAMYHAKNLDLGVGVADPSAEPAPAPVEHLPVPVGPVPAARGVAA